MEWHGPSANNIVIDDERETVDRTIAQAYFESKLENQIRFNESGVFENMTMQSSMFSGLQQNWQAAPPPPEILRNSDLGLWDTGDIVDSVRSGCAGLTNIPNTL